MTFLFYLLFQGCVQIFTPQTDVCGQPRVLGSILNTESRARSDLEPFADAHPCR